MKGYVFVADTKEVIKVSVPDELDEYYALLNCDYIEVIYRYVNGKLTKLIVDEEGKLKQNQIITGMSFDGEESLVGNILIESEDEEIPEIIKKYGMVVYNI